MKRGKLILLVLAYTSSMVIRVSAQTATTPDSTQAIFKNADPAVFNALQKNYRTLEQKLERASISTLQRLQKKELRLQQKLRAKDSSAAQALFSSAQKKYAQLEQQVNEPIGKDGKPVSKNYLPNIDSLQTCLKFLDKAALHAPGLPKEQLDAIKGLSGQVQSLQAQLNTATDIKQFIRARKQQLKEQLEKSGLGNQLKQLNKEVYYYQQQVNEYAALLKDRDKLQQKVLSLVRETPAFKDFMSRNSELAQLFSLPGSGSAPSLAGLQTRGAVQQQLTNQMGQGANPAQYMQQQAQAELNKLKEKLNNLGSGGSSDADMPDFKPNTQKTKTFWKRIEYGLNIQSQKTNALLPVTSDLAVTAGYKINDKSTIGIGVAYKLGWGKNISNIHITSQGVGIRSYLDMRLKGSLWMSGGYEYNYQHEFTKIDQLKDLSAWQKSGLIGIMKKFKAGKKSGSLQLLWDFLSYSQVPKTQPLKFRIGYTF